MDGGSVWWLSFYVAGRTLEAMEEHGDWRAFDEDVDRCLPRAIIRGY
jgi:hypothetical protein